MELTSTRRPESAIRRRGAAIGSISNLWAPVQLLGRRAGELARRFASEPPYLVNMVVNALANRTQRESQLFADAAIVQAIHERRVGLFGAKFDLGSGNYLAHQRRKFPCKQRVPPAV